MISGYIITIIVDSQMECKQRSKNEPTGKQDMRNAACRGTVVGQKARKLTA